MHRLTRFPVGGGTFVLALLGVIELHAGPDLAVADDHVGLERRDRRGPVAALCSVAEVGQQGVVV
jgi:hypothetical protein